MQETEVAALPWLNPRRGLRASKVLWANEDSPLHHQSPHPATSTAPSFSNAVMTLGTSLRFVETSVTKSKSQLGGILNPFFIKKESTLHINRAGDHFQMGNGQEADTKTSADLSSYWRNMATVHMVDDRTVGALVLGEWVSTLGL